MWIVLHSKYNDEELTVQAEHIACVAAREQGAAVTFANGDALAVKESAEEIKRKLEEAELYY